jgi:5-methylcytosine-specific restriction endonuclease McrA
MKKDKAIRNAKKFDELLKLYNEYEVKIAKLSKFSEDDALDLLQVPTKDKINLKFADDEIKAAETAATNAQRYFEKVKAAVRRGRKLTAPGKLSKGIVDSLLVKQNGCCACCGAFLLGKYHLDHILPLSLGGANSDDNVQLLLPKCNLQKYNSTPEKFLERRQLERLHGTN